MQVSVLQVFWVDLYVDSIAQIIKEFLLETKFSASNWSVKKNWTEYDTDEKRIKLLTNQVYNRISALEW
jgi:hypothetical protein